MDPVSVAEVFGLCLGGGCELASMCDVAIVAEDSRIGQPEIELACFPPVAAAAFGGLVGPKRAAELILTGRVIDGREAAAIGLVTRAVPAAGLAEETRKVVDALAAKSRPVLALTKRALRACHPGAFEKSLAEAERIYLEELTRTEDMNEGMAAFLEKRRPVWKAPVVPPPAPFQLFEPLFARTLPIPIITRSAITIPIPDPDPDPSRGPL
jgi:cyclohexa-1,5-dienecarbonyl-CoA hydratase